MVCPQCGTSSTERSRFCSVCGHQLDLTALRGVRPPTDPPGQPSVAADAGTIAPPADAGDQAEALTFVAQSSQISAETRPPEAFRSATGRLETQFGPLQMGAFGTRYHIIKMLGAGGMGAVYHAWDDELGVAVALKVIKPEHLADATAAAELERRFKRELVLARQITHKNVVRIHDLGDVGGIKYLTMPFIHGSDLSTVLHRDGKLTAARALNFSRQILSGLSAAHAAGVVHRDLKPANIMIDADEQAYIMDFGIARSASAANVTAAGAVVGTLAYMAPEQARGQVVDQRADVYSFGLILRDMLVGLRSAANGDSAVSELMARMAAAPSLKALDPSISDDLDRIVRRCLEPRVELRYPDAVTVLRDLNDLDDDGHRRASATTVTVPIEPVIPPQRAVPWKAAIAAAAVLALLGGAAWQWLPRGGPAPAATSPETLTLAVLPFRNASGDPTLDRTGASIAEILRGDLGGSSHLRTASSGRVHQILRDLRIADDEVLSDATLRRIADFTSAQAIVWGQFVKVGNQIQIIASMQDTRRGNAPQTLTATASSESALLTTISELADQVRQRVAQNPQALEEMKSVSLTPTTQSFAALHEFTVGLELARVGNHSEALKHFEIATQEDEEFGLAYARLAQSYDALGYDQEAESSVRRAAALSERVTPYERALIEATRARILNDTPNAIAALEQVAKLSPNDTDTLFELGTLYENSGGIERAREVYTNLLERDPKSVDALLANGRVLVRLQKPNEALDYLSRALSLAIGLKNDDARGNTLQALGIAYKQLDRPDEALKNYQEALAIRRARGQQTAIAASLNEMGQVQSRMGQADEAIKSYDEAIRIRRGIGDKRGIGTVLINLGSLQHERGQADAGLASLREALQIQREVGNPTLEATCLNGIGSIYFDKGQYEDAVTYFDRALALREKQNQPRSTADTLHNLAETAVRTGQFDQALSHYLNALELRRKSDDARGAAIESFSTGNVFEWQGRFGASVKARRDAYEAFRQLNDRSVWYGTILVGYAGALSRSGLTKEAEPLLAEADQLARNLKVPTLTADVVATDGERLLFNGDAGGARTKFEQALADAAKTSDRQLSLSIRLNLEKADTSAPSAARAARLAALAAEADTAGWKHIALDATVLRAETMIALKEYDPAQRELQRALGRIENLNLRVLQAKSHALLGSIAAATGKPADARRYRTQALRVFEELRKEAGTDRVLARSDLAAALKEAQRGS